MDATPYFTTTQYKKGGNEWKVERKVTHKTNRKQSCQRGSYGSSVQEAVAELPLWLDSVDLKISFAACSFLPSLLLPYFCRTSWRWAVFFVFGSRFLQKRPRLTKIIKNNSTDSLKYKKRKTKNMIF